MIRIIIFLALALLLAGCVADLQKNVRKETVVDCVTENGKRKCVEKERIVIVEETPRGDSGYFFYSGNGYGYGYFGTPFGFCGVNHVGQPLRCPGPIAPSNYRWWGW